MGWSSGGDVFDETARNLLAADIDPAKVTRALATLIDKLRDADWDTLDESVREFRHEPAVIAAFRIAAPEYVADIPVPPVGVPAADQDFADFLQCPPPGLYERIAEVLGYSTGNALSGEERVIADEAWRFGRGSMR